MFSKGRGVTRAGTLACFIWEELASKGAGSLFCLWVHLEMLACVFPLCFWKCKCSCLTLEMTKTGLKLRKCISHAKMETVIRNQLSSFLSEWTHVTSDLSISVKMPITMLGSWCVWARVSHHSWDGLEPQLSCFFPLAGMSHRSQPAHCLPVLSVVISCSSAYGRFPCSWLMFLYPYKAVRKYVSSLCFVSCGVGELILRTFVLGGQLSWAVWR